MPETPPPPALAEVASLSFEAALAELDAIVKKLEGGQSRLEEAIADYERGAALRRHCEARLAEAEQKVQAIVAGPGGGPDGATLRESA